MKLSNPDSRKFRDLVSHQVAWCCRSSSWLWLEMRAQPFGRLLQDLEVQRELRLGPNRRPINISLLNEAAAFEAQARPRVERCGGEECDARIIRLQ